MTECEDRTGEHLPEVRTKMTEGLNCPLRMDLAMLVRRLLYARRS